MYGVKMCVAKSLLFFVRIVLSWGDLKISELFPNFALWGFLAEMTEPV